MPTWILKAVLVALAAAGCLLGSAGPAWASGTEGQNTTTSATTGSGGVSVSAGYQAWLPPSSPLGGQAAVVMDHTSSGGGSGGGGSVNPNAPYGCRYQLAPPVTLSLLGPGGPGGGQWVFPICAGPGVINPMPPIWVPTPAAAKPAAAAPPAVNPVVLARQAVSHLGLGALSIHMAPPTNRDQLVGLASWLWVTGWQPRSASATAGPVSASVTAAPVEVVWDLDGHHVTCPGAGTAYQPEVPAAAQHTSCSYTWTRSSAGAPGGTFPISATVYWQVTWSAHGATGGGNLGRIAGPPAAVSVAVAEAQAINTTPSQAG